MFVQSYVHISKWNACNDVTGPTKLISTCMYAFMHICIFGMHWGGRGFESHQGWDIFQRRLIVSRKQQLKVGAVSRAELVFRGLISRNKYVYIDMHYGFQFHQITRVVTWLYQFSVQCYHSDKNSVYMYVCMYIINKCITRIYWVYVLSIGTISNDHCLWWSTLEPLSWLQVWVQMGL